MFCAYSPLCMLTCGSTKSTVWQLSLWMLSLWMSMTLSGLFPWTLRHCFFVRIISPDIDTLSTSRLILPPLSSIHRVVTSTTAQKQRTLEIGRKAFQVDKRVLRRDRVVRYKGRVDDRPTIVAEFFCRSPGPILATSHQHYKFNVVCSVSLTSAGNNWDFDKRFAFIFSSQHVSTTSALFTWWFWNEW